MLNRLTLCVLTKFNLLRHLKIVRSYILFRKARAILDFRIRNHHKSLKSVSLRYLKSYILT